MNANRETSWEIFVADFNEGLQAAIKKHDLKSVFELTVLADLMRIQCIATSENVDLLKFDLPMRLLGTVNNIGERLGAEFESWEGEKDDQLHLQFLSENDQDLFMQLFEELSLLERRAYPPPDLYLGQASADLERCQESLRFLSREINRLPSTD